MYKQRKVLLLFLMSWAYLFLADTASALKYSIEVDQPVKASDELVIKTFKKLNIPFKMVPITNGFLTHYQVNMFSPFHMDLYVGNYNNQSIIRVETPFDRLSRAYTDVLLIEKGEGPFEHKYAKKSHILGSLFTLILPAGGSVYTYAGSSVEPPHLFNYPLTEILIDLALLWVGGKTFFTHGFDPLDRGLVATIILMGGHRIYHLYRNTLAISANNKMVSMGYTFQY